MPACPVQIGGKIHILGGESESLSDFVTAGTICYSLMDGICLVVALCLQFDSVKEVGDPNCR